MGGGRLVNGDLKMLAMGTRDIRPGFRYVESSTVFRTDQVADADVLQRALATLAPRQRAVVVLRVVDDLSEQDVAAALGCSVGTVKSYLSRGLVRLRDALDVNEGGLDA